MIQLAVFLALGIIAVAELFWLRALDRRATRLADRYVELHAERHNSAEIINANRLAFLGGCACVAAIALLAARLPLTQHGWFAEGALFLIIVLIPTSAFLFRVASRLREVGSNRGLR